MNHSFSLLILLLLLISCDQQASTTSTSDETSLRNRIAELEKENIEKDSMLNSSLEFYNQIRTNLEAIELKQQEIRLRSSDPEQSESDKDWILDQINFINFLRTENSKKVKQLLHQLYVKDKSISELEAMTHDLLKTIDAKEFELSELNHELSSLNQSYSKLFDAYQEKYELAEVLRDDLNRVFYSYGTLDELKKNHVVEQKRGFIGIHKDIRVAGNLNQKYFSTLDMREDNEIFIEGSKPQFITDHPTNSYTLVSIGKNTKIQIKDPHEFWKVSRYLVVLVN
jgi:chromosome segregation ATPase